MMWRGDGRSDDTTPASSGSVRTDRQTHVRTHSPHTGQKKKKKDKEREREEKPSSGAAAASSGSTSKPKSSSSGKKGHADRTQRFYALDKGELVQKLMRRWWYAITWPDPACAGNVRYLLCMCMCVCVCLMCPWAVCHHCR